MKVWQLFSYGGVGECAVSQKCWNWDVNGFTETDFIHIFRKSSVTFSYICQLLFLRLSLQESSERFHKQNSRRKLTSGLWEKHLMGSKLTCCLPIKIKAPPLWLFFTGTSRPIKKFRGLTAAYTKHGQANFHFNHFISPFKVLLIACSNINILNEICGLLSGLVVSG